MPNQPVQPHPQARGTVTIQAMRASVIGGSTLKSYRGEIWQLLQYAKENHATIGWLTTAARDQLAVIEFYIDRAHGRSPKCAAKWNGLEKMLHECHDTPVLNIGAVTPESYMMYLQGMRQADGTFYKPSYYIAKTAALHHLFRCHEGLEGYPEGFEPRLKTLKNGFLRTVQQHRVQIGLLSDDDGKKPISPQLYRALCKWFFDAGGTKDLFSYCFLVFSWNLMCRANNTSNIHFSHLGWDNDSLAVKFAQQKGDQMGYTEKFPRHLYANTDDCLFSPIFALAVYLTTFGVQPLPTDPLFPGNDQYDRFSDRLEKMLREHEAEVINMGYTSLSELGTHSIRKGATKWLSGQPGAPSAMAICIRGGWSLGGVKDVYMTYEAEGDHFCGRMLAMLPLLRPTFASAPPEFMYESVSLGEVIQAVSLAFPTFDANGPLSSVLVRCLASLVHHKDKILQLPITHHCRQAVHLFHDAETLDTLASDVKVLHPWDKLEADRMSFGSGIPPHVALLVNQQVLISQFGKFVEDFDDRINRIFDERQVPGGLSMASLREMVGQQHANLRRELLQEIRRYGFGGPTATGQPQENIARQSGHAAAGYQLHQYDGKFHKVPKGWRLPKSVSLRDAWISWNCGDTVNQVPPLRTLTNADVKHLDKLPRQNNESQRPARKTLSDLKLMCNYIEKIAKAAGKFQQGMNRTAIGSCFDEIASVENGLLSGNPRASQVHWSTLVSGVQRRQKEERNSTAAAT